MKIGAYDFNSQFNMNSRIDVNSFKHADSLKQVAKAPANKLPELKDSFEKYGLPISKDFNLKQIYNKDTVNKLAVTAGKLEDFSISPAKNVSVLSQIPDVDPLTVSDEKMDKFLKNAFEVFNAK